MHWTEWTPKQVWGACERLDGPAYSIYRLEGRLTGRRGMPPTEWAEFRLYAAESALEDMRLVGSFDSLAAAKIEAGRMARQPALALAAVG